MRIGLIITLILIIYSCNNETRDKNYKMVLIHRFYSKETPSIDTSYIEVINKSSSSIKLYKLHNHPDSSIIYYYFERKKAEDSILHTFNHPCKKIDSKEYTINRKKYEVERFYFDKENSADEESIIYFSEDYGILLIYNFGWLIMESIFEYNEESNLLLQEILVDSTNDFPLINRKEIIEATVAHNR